VADDLARDAFMATVVAAIDRLSAEFRVGHVQRQLNGREDALDDDPVEQEEHDTNGHSARAKTARWASLAWNETREDPRDGRYEDVTDSARSGVICFGASKDQDEVEGSERQGDNCDNAGAPTSIQNRTVGVIGGGCGLFLVDGNPGVGARADTTLPAKFRISG
jgi:hypothetical protein